MSIKVKILPLSKKVVDEANSLQLLDRFKKKIELLENNFRHPSLEAKLLQPHDRGIWQIRINRQYRAHFYAIQTSDGQTLQIEFIFVGDPHR